MSKRAQVQEEVTGEQKGPMWGALNPRTLRSLFAVISAETFLRPSTSYLILLNEKETTFWLASFKVCPIELGKWRHWGEGSWRIPQGGLPLLQAALTTKMHSNLLELGSPASSVQRARAARPGHAERTGITQSPSTSAPGVRLQWLCSNALGVCSLCKLARSGSSVPRIGGRWAWPRFLAPSPAQAIPGTF